MNNNRGGNHNQRKFETTPMYPNSNQFPHSGVQATNPGTYIIGTPQRSPRSYGNHTPHNITSEVKHNHLSNMAHNQIQMVPAPHISQRQQTLPHHLRQNAPRNLPRGPYQYQVYLPSNMAATYQGSNPFYQFNHQQPSQAVLMPYIQNYHPSNQPGPGMFYSTPPRPIQITNVPPGQQNPPVANMSNAQSSHGLVVQSQPMEMAANTQPLQVPQQPSTAPMQIPEVTRPRRKTAAIKIINPDTGNEVIVISNNTNNSFHVPSTSGDELKKMKVQSQFQSQVQSVVKKDDTKTLENNEGGEKVRIEFESKVKKLVGETTPPKAIEIDEGLLKVAEPINKHEEVDVSTTTTTTNTTTTTTINAPSTTTTTTITTTTNTITSIEESSVEKIDSIPTVDLTANVEEVVLNTVEIDKEIATNSSVPTQEIQSQNTDNSSNISEDIKHVKKITDEEPLKPAKNKKNKAKKKKILVKDNEETIISNVQPSIIEATEQQPAIINTQENKENENDNHNSKSEVEEIIVQKPEEVPQQPQETQNNGIQCEPVEIATPKLPSYLDNLPYAEGQWSVNNPFGKKVYSKLFLIRLGNEAVCQKKPDILKNWGSIVKFFNQPQFNSLGGIAPSLPRSQSASATGFMPAYFKAGNSQRGGMPIMQQPGAKRNSSQGKTASKTAKSNTIHMSLSLREEVKLNQTENAWVPTAVKKATKGDITKDKSEDQLKTEEVNKSVRSILNKITPDNMESLTKSFKALPIDTVERLEKTIDLVFEKAIEEQSFAPLYASLCSAMQMVQVPVEGNKTSSFKKLIISKCQSLFEFDKAEELDSAKKLSEINSCKDPEKKKELQLIYEENERRLRKRSVGNCRFIGELFKQKILTPNIMLYCITNLVTKHVEEPLECLCNLLKTIGKELEAYDLDDIFRKLKALTSKEMKSKIPSRIRFMIQDVIDLRKNNWIPRRVDNKPKLIYEIENDAKNEAIEQSMSLSSSSYNRPDNRDNRRGDEKYGRGSDNKSRRGNENEWNVVQSAKYKQQNYTIDQSKLQGFKDSSSVTTLGPSSKWSFPSHSASSGSGKNSSFASSNPYALLKDDKKLTSTSQIMSSKSLPRKPVIHESEEKQRMMSGVASIASMMPTFAQTTPLINSNATTQIPKETVELDSETADKITLQCKNIIQEYKALRNIEDIILSLTEEESAISTRHDEFVKSLSILTLDLKPNSRTDAGKILAELLSRKIISMTAVIKGIDAVLKDWNDYLVDYPQFFSYIAAIIAPLLISKTANFEFNNLKDACVSICPANSSAFFIEVLQKILSSKETQDIKEGVGGILWIYNKWRASEYVPLDVFMPINVINTYFTKDRVGIFLLSVALCDKMKLTNSKQLYDEMHSWITKNISVNTIKCPQFVRALTIAIVILCLKSNSNSFEDFFDHVHVKLLTCYIRSEPLPEPEIQAREVQCLYGIQIMSAALEHPGGMVLKLFNKLYQDSVISKESFEIWKEDKEYKTGFDEDLETKTMAVVVLNSFFISLQTNDSDEEETVDQ